MFQLDVREQGAMSLWALAGQTLKQQKLMAQQMGYPVILDLLLSSSDKMQYVGKARYKLISLYTVPKENDLFHPTNQSLMNVSNTLAAKLSSRQKKHQMHIKTVSHWLRVDRHWINWADWLPELLPVTDRTGPVQRVCGQHFLSWDSTDLLDS